MQKVRLLGGLSAFNILLSYYNREFPVISFGIVIPIRLRIVGARSPSFPFLIGLEYSLSTRMQGTRFVVCAVFGEPSSLIMMSAFPWSAITMAVYPLFNASVITASEHLSTVSQAFTAAASTPVCPTISGFAKLR